MLLFAYNVCPNVEHGILFSGHRIPTGQYIVLRQPCTKNCNRFSTPTLASTLPHCTRNGKRVSVLLALHTYWLPPTFTAEKQQPLSTVLSASSGLVWWGWSFLLREKSRQKRQRSGKFDIRNQQLFGIDCGRSLFGGDMFCVSAAWWLITCVTVPKPIQWKTNTVAPSHSFCSSS